MDAQIDILQQVHQAAAVQILFLPHAVQQMARPDRWSFAVTVVHPDTGQSVLALEDIQDVPEPGPEALCVIGLIMVVVV